MGKKHHKQATVRSGRQQHAFIASLLLSVSKRKLKVKVWLRFSKKMVAVLCALLSSLGGILWWLVTHVIRSAG